MAYTDRDTANKLGVLYCIGANQTPFLNMVGGLNVGGVTKSFLFPVAQPWALTGASQNTQSEATSAAAGTATTYSRSQDYNTCQIMKYDAAVTYAKQSTTGEYTGIQVIGDQPVQDELSFQKAAALRQMAIDLEYSFLRGSYVAPSTAATNQTTRGITTAVTTTKINANTADLTKALIDEMLRTMAAAGAQFSNMVIFVNGFQKQMISDIYAFAPQDRNVGGVNVKQIETDFAQIGVVYAPQMSTSVLLCADLSVVRPMYCPYNGQLISWTDTALTAAQKGGFWYTQVGLDYGPEEYHGQIYGLTTA